MTRFSRKYLFSVPAFILLTIFVFGCVSTTREITRRKVAYTPRKSSEVRVMTADEVKDRQFFSLGEIKIEFKPDRIADGSLSWVYEQMKPLASTKGAEAIYDIRIDSLNDKGRRLPKFVAYGDAIRFLDIYRRGEYPERNYVILGRVYGSFMGNPMNPGTTERVMEQIRPLASNLGADAIMDLYISNQGEEGKTPSGRWGSGLAIRYIKPGEKKPNLSRPEFIVGIRPWGHLEKNHRDIRIHLGVLLSTAQYYLEHRGFHASIADVPISYRDIDSLDILRKENAPLNQKEQLLFGRDTRYVLIIDKSYDGAGKAVSPVSDTNYISATLISKLTGEIIWENRIAINFDLLERLYDGGNFRADYNRSMSDVYLAAGELFRTLPTERDLAGQIDNNAARNESSLTANEKAIQDNFSNLLKEAGQFILYDAVVKNNMPEIMDMLARGVDINSRGYNGNTPLHAAVANENEELTKFLLAQGAGLQYENAEGLTPLALAEKLNDPDYDLSGIINILRNYGVAERDSK